MWGVGVGVGWGCVWGVCGVGVWCGYGVWMCVVCVWCGVWCGVPCARSRRRAAARPGPPSGRAAVGPVGPARAVGAGRVRVVPVAWRGARVESFACPHKAAGSVIARGPTGLRGCPGSC